MAKASMFFTDNVIFAISIKKQKVIRINNGQLGNQ